MVLLDTSQRGACRSDLRFEDDYRDWVHRTGQVFCKCIANQ